MTAQNLTLERIFESDENFDFTQEKKYFRIKDTDIISRGIMLALYGDECVTVGKVIFSFFEGEVKYNIERNFDDKTVTLIKNDESPINSDTEVSEMIKNLTGMDKNTYEKLLVMKNIDAYSEFSSSPKEYFNSVMTNYGICEVSLAEKEEFYQNKINQLKTQLNYLESIKSADSNADTIALTKKEIADIQYDLNEVNRKLFIANEIAGSGAVLEDLQSKLEETKISDASISDYKRLLEKSDKIEKTLFLINKNSEIIKENSETEMKVSNLNANLNKMKKEMEKGEKAVKLLESSFLYSNEKLIEIYNQFDNYVLDGVNSSDLNSAFSQNMKAYYAAFDKKAEELFAQKTVLTAEYDQLTAEINSTSTALNEAKYPFTKKKAIREGSLCETKLADYQTYKNQLLTTIEEQRSRLEILLAQVSDNEKIIAEAKAKTINAIGKDFTMDEMFDTLNNNELQKQTLYRNQILIASAEREITAVDNKIYENEEAQRSYIEDRTALENAKNTLLGYIKKLEDKLSVINDKMVIVSAQKKYYENVDALEFGDKCPVCNSRILDKTDLNKENQKVSKAYASVLDEQQKALSVKKDYDVQLDKVNLRLGELSSRVNTSTSYLKSLRDTKEAKLSYVKKLLEISEVKNLTSLSKALDIAIKKVAVNANEIAEVSNFTNIEKLALSNIASAKNEIKNIEENILPRLTLLLNNVNDDIALCVKDLSSLSEQIGDTTALALSFDLVASEECEDALNAKLEALNSKKEELSEKINLLNKEILSITYRDDSILISKDGIDNTYPQMVTSLIKDRFAEYFSMLKKAEEEKQVAQDHYVATSRVLKAKGHEIDLVAKEIATNIANINSNNKMLALLNENANFDSSEYNLQDTELLQREIIGEEQKKEMREKIAANENAVNIVELQIKAIKENMELNQIYLDTFAENCTIKNSLIAMLEEKQSTIIDELTIKALNAFILDNITELTVKLNGAEDKKIHISALKNRDEQYFIKRINAILSNLSNGQYSIKKEDKLEIIDNYKKCELTDDEEAAKILIGLSCEQAAYELINDFSDKNLNRLLPLKTKIFSEDSANTIAKLVKDWNVTLLLNK